MAAAIKQYIGWGGFENSITDLYYKIKDSGKDIDFIVGIPRGGLIAAVTLSHRLDIKHMTIDHMETVIDQLDPAKILIVDDISDSGQTLKKYIDGGFITATLDVRFSTVATPDFYSNYLTTTNWIVYPWEAKDSKPIQDYLAS